MGAPHDPTRADAQDWQAGDIAECVWQGEWYNGANQTIAGPIYRERYRVVAAGNSDCRCADCVGAVFLELASFSPNRFLATCFRKVTPKADELVSFEPAFLDRWISQPEITARINRFEVLASAAIIGIASALMVPNVITALLTRAPA